MESVLAADRRLSRSLAAPASLAVVAAALAAAYLASPPAVPLLTPDSPGYLEFSPQRTPGYPFLLKLLTALPGGLGAVAAAQLALLCGAAAIFAWAFTRVAGSLLLGVALLLMVLAHDGVVVYAFMVMTEAPATAAAMLTLALALAHGHSPRPVTAAALSGVSAAMLEIRPSTLLLAAIPAVLLVVDGPRIRRSARWGGAWIAPALAVLVAGAVATQARHGVWHVGETFLGTNLIGRAPLAATWDGPAPWLADAVAPERALFAAAPDWRTRFWLELQYYIPWVYDYAMPEFTERAGGSSATAAEIDTHARSVALAVLAHNPRPYVESVLTHWAGAWTASEVLSPEETAAIAAWLAPHQPAPRHPSGLAVGPTQDVRGLRASLLLGLAATSAAVVILPLCLARRRLPALVPVLFAAGAAVHGSVLLTVLLEPAFLRYILPLWPLMALCVVGVPVVAVREAAAAQLWRRGRTCREVASRLVPAAAGAPP